MHPVILKLGPLTIHSYGFFLTLGIFAGLWLVAREAKRQGMDPGRVIDLCLYISLAAVIGAHIPYVLLNWNHFAQNPVEILLFWKGGLMFHGGLLAALAVLAFLIRRYRLSFWKVADLLGLAVPLGHAIGRLGCFFAGCCYGKPSDLPWAVTFPGDGMAPAGVPLHPTQLYTSLGNLLIFLFLYFVLRPRKRFDGQIFLAFAFTYSLFRFGVEMLRGDDRGRLFLDLFTFSQSLSIAFAVLSAAFYFKLKKKALP